MSPANEQFVICGQCPVIITKDDWGVFDPDYQYLGSAATTQQPFLSTRMRGMLRRAHLGGASVSKMCLQLLWYNSAVSCEACVPASAFHEKHKRHGFCLAPFQHLIILCLLGGPQLFQHNLLAVVFPLLPAKSEDGDSMDCLSHCGKWKSVI